MHFNNWPVHQLHANVIIPPVKSGESEHSSGKCGSDVTRQFKCESDSRTEGSVHNNRSTVSTVDEAATWRGGRGHSRGGGGGTKHREQTLTKHAPTTCRNILSVKRNPYVNN
ncbi:hypothetical protein MSG28_013243 [Choristoneura fumiferana]|uniref:Uncharacterized protein n=1 Tax=Choristoneura fumiferana TaxID=7141 RepID=A0ACC0KT29_CHOFU|nr:hypothetical protein MSG28_013243 [Choristoneura fumiferana]